MDFTQPGEGLVFTQSGGNLSFSLGPIDTVVAFPGVAVGIASSAATQALIDTALQDYVTQEDVDTTVELDNVQDDAKYKPRGLLIRDLPPLP